MTGEQAMLALIMQNNTSVFLHFSIASREQIALINCVQLQQVKSAELFQSMMATGITNFNRSSVKNKDGDKMMEKLTHTSRAVLMMAIIAGLSACEDAEIVTPPPPAPPPVTTFKVGGSVSGLPGSGLVLQLNGAEELTVGANGKFVFPKPLNKGSAYTVTVKASPTVPVKQTCTVNQGSGTIAAAAINNVAITCVTNTYAVGGKVSGLSGKGLVIQLNGANDLAIEKNGNFIFPGVRLPDGSDYSVAIKKTPAKRKCKIEPISAAPDRDTLHIVSITCSRKSRR